MEGVTHTFADPGSCSDRPGVGRVGSESSADRPAWLSWEPWLGHVLQQKSFGEKHEALVTEGCSQPPPVLPSTPSNVRLAVSETCLFGVQAGLQVAFPQVLGSEACATMPRSPAKFQLSIPIGCKHSFLPCPVKILPDCLLCLTVSGTPCGVRPFSLYAFYFCFLLFCNYPTYNLVMSVLQ